ncbi:Gti1/Pac2 family-domain-containing protein [Rhodocollybia butyracea]|uniref:Gti1/Pac2 family-domain-containing protein n=1 Tax=Rhodocollybia butyracea TaxID=206335 RepID=A0A9P5PHP6_9AGAR|nr:Gti1/Pac2 family-domain-containing protein [Rhodocollybia butyracea]
MQRATCTNIRIRSPSDARVIFHAVLLSILPMVTRRLDAEERSLITPGSCYVWEERGPHAELTGVGIERWTDGIRWGPSRVREGFLFYHEKQEHHLLFTEDTELAVRSSPTKGSRPILIKQTYTVFVETPRGQRKWHLIAYFNEESLPHLQTVDDLPRLASLPVPHGKYKSARCTKGRPDHIFNPDQDADFPRIEYIPYKPKSPSMSDRSSQSASPPDHYAQIMTPEDLAPLAYLQSMPPLRRHPEDEKTLMLLASRRF